MIAGLVVANGQKPTILMLSHYFLQANENEKTIAGKLKATHKISFADAWVAAIAIMLSAILVHKDPEFEELEDELEMLKLPYKKS